MRTLVELFAAMVLSRCGCADAACITGYWQLQAVKTSQQITVSGATGGTSGATTGQTYTCTNGQCDVTITVQTGAVQQFQGIGFNALLLQDSSGNWGPSNWNIIPTDVRVEIMRRLFGPGHFTEMRLFGNPDASELLEARQAGMTNAVPIMDPCDDTGDAVSGVAADYRNAGVPVKAVSIANKPNNDNQMHCSRLPASIIADDVASLHQALNAHGLSDVLVLAPDTVEWSPISAEELSRYTFDPGSTIQYLQAIGNNSAALSALGAFSTQSYGTAITTDWQNYAVQHGKPYWVTMSVEPWYDSGQLYQPADAVTSATLLSDLNHGVNHWFYWTWDHLICIQCHPQSIGEIQMQSLYYTLTNISGAFDIGAMVRRSVSSPTLPTADMHFNYGAEPAVTAAAAKNPDGSWGIGLVNLTGIHAGLLNDATYDSSAAKTLIVQVCIEELANSNLTFHQKISMSGNTSTNNGSNIAMTNGCLEVPVQSTQTVTLVSR